MSDQLSTLSVRAMLASDDYIRGAQAINAANREMAQSGAQAGAAFVASEQKIGLAVSAVARLTRSYGDGGRAFATFQADLKKLNGELEKGLDVKTATTFYTNMVKSLGYMADGADIAAQGYATLGKIVSSTNEQLRDMGVAAKSAEEAAKQAEMLASRVAALKAQFDPASVAAQALSKELSDLAEAERLGIQITGGYDQELERIILRHDSAAAAAKRQREEYARLSEQGKASLSADRSQATFNSILGVGRSSGLSAQQSASVFEEAAKQNELFSRQAASLRAVIDPAGASLAKMNEELEQYRALLAASVITQEEFTRGEALAKARHDQFTGSLQKTNNHPGGGSSNNWRGIDAGYQLQDAIVQAVGGGSLGTIALQQGPQLAGAFAGQSAGGALKTLAGGLASLVSVQSLVAIGFVGLTAATAKYASEGLKPVRSMDDALKAQADSVALLKARYGELADQVKVSANLMGTAGIDASLRSNETVMRAVSRQQTADYMKTLQGTGGAMSYITGGGTSIESLKSLSGNLSGFQAPVNALLESVRGGTPDLDKFRSAVEATYAAMVGQSEDPSGARAAADAVKALAENALSATGSVKVLGENGKETSVSLAPFADAIARLKVGLADGHPNLEQFYGDVERIGQSKGLQSVADQVLVLGKGIADLNQKTRELDLAKIAIFNDRAPSGLLLSQGKTNTGVNTPGTMGDLALYESQQKVAASRTQQALNAQLNALYARNPEEKAAAARAQASAVYNNEESPDQRRQRIDNAELVARRTAEKELNDAQKERVRSLEASVAAQKNELDMVGKTGGELVALRMQYEQIAQLRMNAAKIGVQVDEQEIELIKRKAAEAGRYADLISRAKLNDDLSFQERQFGRSTGDQQIAGQLRSAGLPEDLNSAEANRMRSLAEQQQARQQLNGFYSDFVAQLRQNGGKAGKALGDALREQLLTSVAKMGEQAFDKLSGWFIQALTGQGGSQAGGTVGAFSSLLGLNNGRSQSSSGASSGTFGVTGIASAAAGAFGFGGAANNNGSAASGAVDKAMGLLGTNESANRGQINSFLKAGGVDIDAAQTAWCAGFVNSSLKQVGVDGSGSLVANSFQSWGAKIDPSKVLKGDVLLQNHGLGADQAGGHVGLATGATRMGQSGLQLEMLSGNSADSVQKSWINASELQVKRANEASAALEKMGGASTKATDSLSQVGSAFAGKGGSAAGQIAGSFDWSSLKSPSFKTNTTLSDFIGAPGGVTPTGFSAQATGGSGLGLLGTIGSGIGSLFKNVFTGIGSLFHFADGTESAPGGLAIVGERGRELVNMPRGAQVVPNHRTESLLAAANGNRGDGAFAQRQAKPTVNVNIMGNAYGDQHLQKVVNAGVSQGLQTQAVDNERGRTGDAIRRYNQNKG